MVFSPNLQLHTTPSVTSFFTHFAATNSAALADIIIPIEHKTGIDDS